MARRKKRRFHLFRFLFEVLILAALSVGLFLASKFVKIERGSLETKNVIKNENIPANELTTMKEYKDIALFGVDSRNGALESGTNSDTIMICSINQKTHEVTLTSVYRDTYLDAADGTYRKCTEVYAVGGAEQAISMLNKNLDLNISDYVTVNFQAVVEIIDLFGGVDINLSEGEVQWINNYLVEGRQVLGRECEDVQGPGLQHLNGMQALAYSRIRYIGLDYERTERQRTVLMQLFAKAKDVTLMEWNTMLDKVLPLISTSLSTPELLMLAAGIGNYHMGESSGFPFDKTTAQLWAGDCVVPINLAANVSQLHKLLYGSQEYVPSQTVQEISTMISQETGIY